MIDLKNKKILLIDLDGTLIETISGETFPKGLWDMKTPSNSQYGGIWFPEALLHNKQPGRRGNGIHEA